MPITMQEGRSHQIPAGSPKPIYWKIQKASRCGYVLLVLLLGIDALLLDNAAQVRGETNEERPVAVGDAVRPLSRAYPAEHHGLCTAHRVLEPDRSAVRPEGDDMLSILPILDDTPRLE